MRTTILSWLYLISPFAHLVGSTLIFIALTPLFSAEAFLIHSTLQAIGFAILISAFVWVFYMLLAFAICSSLAIIPGLVLVIAFGVAAGSISLWLVSALFPLVVVFPHILGAIPYALADTLLVLSLGWLTGSLKTDLRLWPTKNKAQ